MGNKSSSTNSELTINDLPLLCNTLNPVASKCFDLGLQLGVEFPKIRTIEHNCRKYEDQLREIVLERLKQDSPLTWHDIVTALRSLRMREYSLASQIEHDHKLQPSTSVASQFSTMSSVPPASSSMMSEVKGSPDDEMLSIMSGISSRESQTQVRGSSGGECDSLRENCKIGRISVPKSKAVIPWFNQPSTQMMGQTPGKGPPYGNHFQPPLLMMGETSGKGPLYGEDYQYSTQTMDQTPVMRPHHREKYKPPTLTRKPMNIKHYPPFSPAWDRVARDTPQYVSHLPRDPPYIDVVNQHSDVLTETISSDLTFFINKFIELGFASRTATANILSQHGVGNRDKAEQILNLLSSHYNRTCNKEKWFDKFVSVFSSDPAYEDLAQRMMVALEKLLLCDFSSSVTEPLPQLGKSPLFRSPMDAFVHYIKVRYKQCEIERNLNVLKWPPTPSKIFINLACIDWESVVNKEEADEYTRAMVEDGNVDVIMKRKTNIDFSDIARDLPASTSKRVVLVEGAPGVGKSTFAWEFCRRWERGEIAQQYQLVLLLRLRDKRMSSAKSLRDLIYHPSEDMCIHFTVELVDCLGVNTLIILEGFDELADTQRSEPSIFLQLILGHMLPLATILVTSRPWATGALLLDIKHRIFQHIEILGFTEKNITKYVTSVFTEESKKTASAIDQSVGGLDEVNEEAKKNIDDVMAYIGKFPQIKACMYIPLNAAIVVSIYRESMKSKWVLPTTLTELYQALTRILLLRYLRGHAQYSHQKYSVESFEDLPGEVYSQLIAISKIAYNGIYTDSGKSIQLIFPDIPDDFETLGLMQSVSQLFMDGQRTSHNFLHLTFQEFLAAFFISTMSSAKQLEYFQRHEDGRLRVVLRFLAGLTKLSKVTSDQLRSLLGEPTVEQSDKQQTPYCNPMRPDVCVSAHHTNWLFEAQNSELLQSLFHNHTVSFTFTRGMVQLDYYSVGYCIAHSHGKWSLIFLQDAEKEKLHMLMNVAKGGDGNPKVTSLKTTSMTPENMNILVNGFSSHLEELYYLKIPDHGNSLSLQPLSTLHILELQIDNDKSAFDISCDLSFSSLETLIISSSREGTEVGTKTCKALGKLLSSTTSLKEFHLSPYIRDHECRPYVSNENMEVITKLLSDSIVLPLKSLDINCKCTFTTTATRSLVQFITRSTTLQYLKMHIDTFADVYIFTKGLSDNIALALMSLDIHCKCTFTATATRFLVQFITKCTTLQYIGLCHVTFSAQQLIELTEAIHHCSRLQKKQLKKLTFRVECSEDVINLRHMINDYPHMRKSITDWDGVTTVNSSLTGNDDGRKATAVSLGLGCSEDTYLNLMSMGIGDAGAVALAQALHHNSTLQTLSLTYNSISDAGTVALAEALYHNSTLKELDLYGNVAIGRQGTHQLIQALTANTSITTYGLKLPKRCKEYATKCTHVKDRILFC